MLALSVAAFADTPRFSLAISASDIDVAQCESYGDGKSRAPAKQKNIESLLGLAPFKADAVWNTGPLAGEFRHFRLAFNRPINIGTICTSSIGDLTISFLNSDAPFPGDLTNDAQWTKISTRRVATLPPGVSTRALRFTHKSINDAWENGFRDSRFPMTLLLTQRAYCPTELGANSEWSTAGGEALWSVFFPLDTKLDGVALMPASSLPAVTALATGVETHPVLAPADKWTPATLAGETSKITAVEFLKPVNTKSIRLRAKDLRTPIRVWGQTEDPLIFPLTLLTASENPPTSFVPKMPFTFPYKMPLDGFAAIRIKNEKGEAVRRLIAEVPRKQGDVLEGWDLKDDEGRYVPPGKYEWYGIARQPLKLTYEMTVYNAGKPPWLAPVPSLGWWLADHCPPETVCAVGNRVMMGAFGAEFGVGMLATDLEGTKVWHNAMGAPRIVTDGHFAYIVNNDNVVRLDPEKGYAAQTIHHFAYNAQVPGHSFGAEYTDRSGAAIFGGKLYVSYNSPMSPWIRSTFEAGHIDRANCYPRIPEKVKVHDTDYSPVERLLSAFMTITSSNVSGWDGADPSGPNAHTMILRLNQSVPVGSIMLPPGDVTVFALREGKPLPAWAASPQSPQGSGANASDLQLDSGGELDNRFDPDAWVRLTGKAARNHPLIVNPETGVYTKTLVFVGNRLNSLQYALTLDRRYRDVKPDAKIIPLEGSVTPEGGWRTTRGGDRPISPRDPCLAAIVWNKPPTLRGFALIGPMKFAGTAVDMWNGPLDATIDDAAIKDNKNWTAVMVNAQNRNDMKMSWHSPRVLLGDFGAAKPIRALRVRVYESPTMNSADGGFDAFVAFEPIGNDAKLRPNFDQRITIVDLPNESETKSGAVKHFAIPAPGMMTFDKAGNLFIASERNILRIEAADVAKESFQGRVLVPREKCPMPRGMAIDEKGALYIVDATIGTVRVFDSNTGEQLRMIGTPGGPAVGPFDPTRLYNPTNITLDAAGKLWIAEAFFQPKRFTRWSTDGKLEKEFMGPTQYGGGGMIDPRDPSVINHMGMKFRIDFPTRTWKLESRLAMIAQSLAAPDRVVYHKNRRYLVGDGNTILHQGFGPLMVIGVEEKGRNRPMIVAGLLRDWQGFGNNKESLLALAASEPANTSILWCDLNGDERATPDEVQSMPGSAFKNIAGIGDDLSLNFSGNDFGWRIRPSSIREDGRPIFDLNRVEKINGLTARCQVDEDGWTFVLGEKMIDPAGKLVWTYPDNWAGVQNSNKVPWGFYGRPPGVLSGTLSNMGVFKAAGETLYAANSNHGEFFVFTRDGLFIGTVFGGPVGYGKRFFSMPECEPGKTDLTDLRRTVENFNGHIVSTPDGKIYAIAGKNHISMVRVDGLEKLPRMSGSMEVNKADLAATEQWAARAAQIRVATKRPAVAAVSYMSKPAKIDGDILTDWPGGPTQSIRMERDDQGNLIANYNARLAFDQDNLYVAAQASSRGPMNNRGGPARNLFITGDCVDVHLGLDPAANPRRETPVLGDIRVLITRAAGKPTAVLMRPVTGGKSLGGEAVTYTSPVGQEKFEEVGEINDAKIAIVYDGGNWTVEAAIPWKSLGATAPKSKVNLRGDLGVLQSDPNGQMTIARYYWANKSYIVLSDQPAESRLHPALWGELQFAEPFASDADLLAVPDKSGLGK